MDLDNYNKRYNKETTIEFLFYKDSYYRNILYHKLENTVVKSILQHIYKPNNLLCISQSTKLRDRKSVV